MNVSLTPQLEDIIRQKVATGLYGNASEVVREALRQMDDRDRYRRLKAAIAEGDADIANGRVKPWTKDTMEQLKRKADEADRAELPIDDDLIP